MKEYFYKQLHKYISTYIRAEDSFVELFPQNEYMLAAFKGKRKAVFTKNSTSNLKLQMDVLRDWEDLRDWRPRYILINGYIHYEKDIQTFFNKIRANCTQDVRLILVYYNNLWMPALKLSTWLGLRQKMPEQNWVSHQDMDNFLLLSDFEKVLCEQKILLPVRIPLISNFMNKYIAPLPFFRLISFVNVLVAKPIKNTKKIDNANGDSVSIIIPARNEAGNIENAIKYIPKIGKKR